TKIIRGIKVTTIMTKKQKENIEKSTDHADGMNYKLVQEYVDKHKKTLIQDLSKPHQFNVLTIQGWRCGNDFKNYNYDFYDPNIKYNDDDHLLVIYGFQIIEYP
ncbi:MAG: hypothetical protein Q8J97_15275, partial [Flavobacteriaceae bacterium]|nr:hypothetical protein [Flavobacteriaceae bacterium]